MPRSSTGDYIPDDLPKAYTYNGDGTVATVALIDGSRTWLQTNTYVDGKLIAVSAWVLQ